MSTPIKPSTEHLPTIVEIEKTKPKSPFPLRMLSRGKDEEAWLSGSELKTDNSSSDDEASPEAPRRQQQLAGALPKIRKHKIRNKKRIKFGGVDKSPPKMLTTKLAPAVTTTNTDTESGSGIPTVVLLPDSELTSINKDEHSMEKQAMDCLTVVEEEEDYQWRPKRGSITLPGLVSELERVQII